MVNFYWQGQSEAPIHFGEFPLVRQISPAGVRELLQRSLWRLKQTAPWVDIMRDFSLENMATELEPYVSGFLKPWNDFAASVQVVELIDEALLVDRLIFLEEENKKLRQEKEDAKARDDGTSGT